jgi:hypothetical protein
MKEATNVGSEQKSGKDRVTIKDDNKGKEGADQSITPDTMAPKPALYETGKGMNNERNMIAASDEAHYARKEDEGEFHDDASEADHSVVSHSDWSTTDGEDSSIASNSRKERRSRRRSSSRRRRSRSRSKDGLSTSKSKGSSARGRREREEQEEEDTVGEEALQEEYEEKAKSRSSSAKSNEVQGDQEKAAKVITAGKTGGQPYTKLLNFNALYRTEQDRAPRYTEELEKVTSDWDNCKALLDRLSEEVKHANHLFHISDASFHQYSHVMYTIHKDIFLDDDGNRVLSSARQQLLLKQRGTVNVEGRDELKDSAISTSDAYLGPLYNSFSVLTDSMMKAVLDRESDNGKKSATLEFQEFGEELSSQAEAMKALGDSVVQEMEGSEQDIQNAFSRCQIGYPYFIVICR